VLDFVEISNVLPPGRTGDLLPSYPVIGSEIDSLIPPAAISERFLDVLLATKESITLAAKSGNTVTIASPTGFLETFSLDGVVKEFPRDDPMLLLGLPLSTSNASTNIPFP
jgi:hypothetical protein